MFAYRVYLQLVCLFVGWWLVIVVVASVAGSVASVRLYLTGMFMVARPTAVICQTCPLLPLLARSSLHYHRSHLIVAQVAMVRISWDEFVLVADDLKLADTLVRDAEEELVRAIRMWRASDRNGIIRSALKDAMMSARESLAYAMASRQTARDALLHASHWWRVRDLPAAGG